MKRLLAAMLGVLLLCSSMTLMAEPEQTDPGTVTEQPHETEPTETEPTETEPTETEPDEPPAPPQEFHFEEYSRYYDSSTGVMTVSWNYVNGEGRDVVRVTVDGRSYSVTGSKGRFSVKLGTLAAGTYDVAYVLWQPSGDEIVLPMDSLTVDGTRALKLDLSVDGNLIIATLSDSYAQPVAQYPLSFVLNDSTRIEYRTNQFGQVNLSSRQDLTSVVCTAAAATVDGVDYDGAEASWQADQQAVTTTRTEWEPEEDEPTTTRSRWRPTQATTTAAPVETRTYATITGAGTTAVEGDRVAVNATFDEGVPEAFGLKPEDFHERARLLISSQLYADIVGNTRAAMMMTLSHSDYAITDQDISRLVSGRSKYSRYAEIQRVPVVLGLEFLNESGKTVDISVAPQDSYLVRLPVPASMLDCPVLAVALIEGDHLTGLTDVQVRNGYLEFETNGMAAVAVLGFGDGAIRTGGGVAWQLLVLLGAGILLLAAAATLMFFFVWRKPKTAKAAAGKAAAPSADGKASSPKFMLEDVTAERPAQEAEEAQQPEEAEQPEDNGVDLYSSSERKMKKDE